MRPRITDTDVIERFLDKVEFGQDNCWKWKPANDDEYGIFWTGEADRTAHRVSFRIFRGALSGSDVHVHHTCQRKNCVNPYHLEVMGASEHMQMRASDGHKSHGDERSDGISAEKVREIRERVADGEKQKDVADDLAITEPQVSRIVNNKLYTHID